MTSALVIVAQVGVATWSLPAISRLVDVNRDIATQSLPDVSRIFDACKQAYRGRGGSGLGLAIAKGLVEARGGRIQVESEEGQGSRFLVRLPRDGAPPVVAASAGGER